MVKYIIENKDFLTIVIAFFSLLTSLIAIILSIVSAVLQNKFNRNSVQPYCDIFFETNLNYSKLEICNNGLGVMVISKISYYNTIAKTEEDLSQIFESVKFKSFCARTFDKSSVAADSKEIIYEAVFLSVNELDKTIDILKNFEIHVYYSDIYGKKMIKKIPLNYICDTYIQSRKQKRTIK